MNKWRGQMRFVYTRPILLKRSRVSTSYVRICERVAAHVLVSGSTDQYHSADSVT
jgi:hypothetical protein